MTKAGNGTCVGECPEELNRLRNIYNTLFNIKTIVLCISSSYVSDIDECRDGTHQCRYNQICENTRGSYHCTCPRGYRSQGVGRPCIGTYNFVTEIINTEYKYNLLRLTLIVCVQKQIVTKACVEQFEMLLPCIDISFPATAATASNPSSDTDT